MRKALILIFIVITTIALTYTLIHYIGMQGFAFAWALNFLLMACVLFFTETLKGQLTSHYYNEKSWEQGGKIYQSIGIDLFRKLLVLIGWEKLNKKSNPVEKNTKALMHLNYRTKQSELGHVIILIIVLGFNVFVAFKFGILKSLWLLILNILFNLYPVLLQRYNRPRIERAINISKHKHNVKAQFSDIPDQNLQEDSRIAGNNTPTRTPQGFYIDVDSVTQVWEQLLLAQNTANNAAGTMSLKFQPASATLQSTLQINQLFLVISYDNGTALTNFSNEIEIEGWPFKLNVPKSSVPGAYSNVIIFKFCQGALIDIVKKTSLWNMSAPFNDTNGLATLSTWLQNYIQAGMDKFTIQQDSDYANFHNIVTTPNWNGIIALGVDIPAQDVPQQVQGSLAGINSSLFFAHHFGVNVGSVANNVGTADMQPTSSLFGLIDYEDQAIEPPAGTLQKLKVAFINSKICNYNITWHPPSVNYSEAPVGRDL